MPKEPSDPEGRYAPVEDIKTIVLCLQCGCLVGNQAEHDLWHYDNEVGFEP